MTRSALPASLSSAFGAQLRGAFGLTLLALPVLGCHPGAPPAPRVRPKFVVVLLDDADVEVTESMPRLRSMFIDTGVRFTANIANTPLCGPARATILSGQYAHNTKVYSNTGPNGGYVPWAAANSDDHHIGVWLQAQEYRTGLFGKYLNDFPAGRPETYVPRGWDDFRGILSDREAHNNRFSLNENGTVTIYEAGTGGYQTDVLSQRLQAFIREGRGDRRPFFALLAVSAPHVPPEPAARHLTAFPGEKAARKPSFDEADLSDKPKALREQAAPLTRNQQEEIDETWRAMRRSLLSVEDSMEALIGTLGELDELSNTYIFLASDNGWFRGEHRIPAEKYAPYEESIRVPLMVRGPGIARDLQIDQVVGLVDLAPTILDLAGGDAPGREALDGRSIVPLLHLGKGAKLAWRESTLIEHFGGGAPFRVRSYSGLRSATSTYVEYATGEREYYDLTKDPYQLENIVSRLDEATSARLHARVEALKDCRAGACRMAEGESTLAAR